MKSVGLLSSNLPRVIDRSNLSFFKCDFFFISILMMTQGTIKQTTEPMLGTPILRGMTIKLQPLLQQATPSRGAYGYRLMVMLHSFFFSNRGQKW